MRNFFLYRQATYVQKENGLCEQNGSSDKGIGTIVEGDGFVKFLLMHVHNLNTTREYVSILKTLLKYDSNSSDAREAKRCGYLLLISYKRT